MKKIIKEAAERLRVAADTQTPCNPVRDLLGTEDLELAYVVQDISTDRRVKEGARIVGSKIGLTSVSVQKQLGVDQPDFGVLFDNMEVKNGLEVNFSELMQPKVEAEVSFVLGKDLNFSSIGSADVMSAINYAVASIEIVGSRIKNWDIKITDTIADNASASHFVLGHRPRKLTDLDMTALAMTMEVNGEKVSEGNGAACMGSPVNAVVWLANKMAALGRPLKAGDIVMSGALGPMAPVKPGDEVVANIEGLGRVSVNFSE